MEAAFHCICERGIVATSTHAIAARAGLNQGSIHYYFKNKDDLLKRLVEILFQTFILNIETIAESRMSPAAKLESILESGFNLIVHRREEFLVMIAFWAHALAVGGDMLRLYERLFSHFRSAVVKTLEEDESMMQFDSNVRRNVALLVIGGIQGLGLHLALEPEALNASRVEEFMKSLLHRALTSGGIGLKEDTMEAV